MTKSLFARFVVPLISVLGLLYAVYYIVAGSAEAPGGARLQLVQPPSTPFQETISGSGIIEANSRNIKIGSHQSGVAQTVYVTEGQAVEKNAPLFKLDDREARASYQTQISEVSVAAARVQEAKALLDDQKDQLQRLEQLKQGVSVSVDRLERARYAVETAKAKVQVAESNLKAATQRRDQAKVILDQMTVNAPIDGRVLKVNLRPGEFVQAGETETPPVIVGNDRPLFVRVSVDENDVWRFKPNSQAEGALRSNRAIHFPLKFVRIEPYVVPKTSLTGTPSERVDTRVLEILYQIGDTDTPLYIGQQVDVFIASGGKQDVAAEQVTKPSPSVAPQPAPAKTKNGTRHKAKKGNAD